MLSQFFAAIAGQPTCLASCPHVLCWAKPLNDSFKAESNTLAMDKADALPRLGRKSVETSDFASVVVYHNRSESHP